MKNITQALKVIALALILSFGISYVYAWTAPTVTPPGGNVSAPINTSATAQYKEGALGVGGLLKGYGDIQAVTKVEAPQYCIGASCITSWPTGGGVTPPAGSEFLDTSATAQTKAGDLKVLGNLGVGTANPGAKFEVNGNALIDGELSGAGTYGVTRIWADTLGSKQSGDPLELQYAVAGDVVVSGTDSNLKVEGTGNSSFAGNVGVGTLTPQKKLEIKGDHSSTQARLFSDNYGQGVDGANTAVMSLWASEPGWTWGGVGIGNNINGSPYYGRVTNTRGGSWVRLLDNSISLHTVNSSGTDTGGLDVTNGSVTVTDVCTTAGKCLSTAGEGVGVGQTWQNLTGSRAFGTTYTNSTGKPIMVVVNVQLNAYVYAGPFNSYFYINGGLVETKNHSSSGTNVVTYFTYNYVIPNGTTYMVNGGNKVTWWELR